MGKRKTGPVQESQWLDNLRKPMRGGAAVGEGKSTRGISSNCYPERRSKFHAILREEAWPGVQKEICKLFSEGEKIFFGQQKICWRNYETAIWRIHRPKTSLLHSEEQRVETTRGTLKVEMEELKRKEKVALVTEPSPRSRGTGRQQSKTLWGPRNGGHHCWGHAGSSEQRHRGEHGSGNVVGSL